MPTLTDYDQFGGHHPETAAPRNALAYQGARTPHTGGPPSEALLFGLTGGITVMYFVFDYEGHDPHLYVGTRNTFDPVDTLLRRLPVAHDETRTTSEKRARDTLVDALDAGRAPIVWLDREALPYHESDGGMGLMVPVVVIGYEPAVGRAVVADLADVPLEVPADALDAARLAQKRQRQRMVLFREPGTMADLGAVTRESLEAMLVLMTEKPPRGPASNFGLAALKKWADLAGDGKSKRGWGTMFPPGRGRYLAHRDVYELIEFRGSGGGGARPLYADFLDEAAAILEIPALREVAGDYRDLGERWRVLARAFLPDDVPLLAETRELLHERERRFREQGAASLDRRRAIRNRLEEIAATIEPFTLEGLPDQILALHDHEQRAVERLREALAG